MTMKEFAEEMGCAYIDLRTAEEQAIQAFAMNSSLPFSEPLAGLYQELKKAAKVCIMDHNKKGRPGFNKYGASDNIREIGQRIFEQCGGGGFRGVGHKAMQAAYYRLYAELPQEITLDQHSEDGDPRDPLLLQYAWDGIGPWLP